MRAVRIADLFCGAGGTSTGAIRAAKRLGFTITDMLAINHWSTAVKTHELNHPQVRHLCADLNAIDPRLVTSDDYLDLLLGSPECTSHSYGRGAMPCDDQSRASAWHVLHWIEKKKPRAILLENVKQFLDWGPLYPPDYRIKRLRSRPIRERNGELFQAFINAIAALGYNLEWRIQDSADFGDATNRLRLIIRGRRGTGAIHWPAKSHGNGTSNQWRPARSIIDWSLKGRSIYGRKIALNTLRRIDAGMKRFNGPFLVKFYGTSTVADLDQPLDTITAGGNKFALCEPFLIQMAHTQSNPQCRVYSVEKPMPVITTCDAWALAQPFIVKYYGSGGAVSIEEPLDTITTKDRFGLVELDGSFNRLDILLRCLQPHELAAAMSFPSDYRFAGTRREKVEQIGNAVPVELAAAHAAAALTE